MSVIIEDGIYEILYAVDPTKSMDCKGANDQSGSNIWLFDRNHTAAQFWSVTNYDDGVQIICALSGRSLDLAGNDLRDGANIRQWEDNNSHAQRWDIEPDGKTVTLNGTSYKSYVIKSHDTTFAIDVSGGGAKSKTNIQIYTANSTDAQRWIFIPIPYFNEQGTYKIISSMDYRMCADVAGGSTAKGANLQLYPDSGTAAQSWYTSLNDDQTITFINTNSMKAMDCYGAHGSGDNAVIHPINRTVAQCFLVKRYGTMTYAGQTVPTYLLEVQAGSGGTPAVLDADHAQTKKGTNLSFWTEHKGANQLWALIPEAAKNASMPTPAFYDYGTSIGNGRTSAEFQFACNWTNYQIRSRYRTKGANSSGWTEWSSWKSAFDGLGGNNGWGDEWAPNIQYSKASADRKSIDVPIPESYQLDGSNVIAMQCQVEMRTFKSFSQKDSTGYTLNCQDCGASAAKTKTYYWKPTAKVTSAVLNGDGLSIGYSSDFEDGGCTVQVWYGDLTATATGQFGGSGSVLIPNSRLTSIPSGSATCKVQVATADAVSDIATGTVTITNASGKTTFTVAQGETEYGTHTITINGLTPATNSNDRIALRLTYGGGTVAASVKQTTESATIYEAVSPLNSSIYAIVWMTKSDGTWDVQQLTLKPISDHVCCWTFDGGGAVLDYGLSSRISQEDAIERDSETYKIVGRDYAAYRLKQTKTRDLSVTGVILNKVKGHGSYDQFVALLNAGHATYRNNRGEILSVAVTGISKPLEHPDYIEIKVTQHQETR